MNFPLRAWREALAAMRLPRPERRPGWRRKADRIRIESLEPRQLLTVQPPILLGVNSQWVNQGDPLSVPITAQYGSGAPQQSLAFSLFQAPAGVTISGSGSQATVSWNTVGVAAGNYEATVKVIENGDPALSAVETFPIQVVDSGPTLSVPSGTIDATVGQQVTFTATATDPGTQTTAWGVPGAETLTYSLEGTVPAGAQINPQTGVFTWTPTADQGPSSTDSDASMPYSPEIVVTDSSSPSESDSLPVTIDVKGAISLNLIDDDGDPLPAESTIVAGQPQAFTFTADADDTVPGDKYSFSLDPGAPAGASIDKSSGDFSWAPTDAQSPGIYSITVRVTSNNIHDLTAAETIQVDVAAPLNYPPTISLGNSNSNLWVTAGQEITFTAQATDPVASQRSAYGLPAETFTYALVGEPDGASIDEDTGDFTWTPDTDVDQGVYTFDVTATGSQNPQLTSRLGVAITVEAPPFDFSIPNQQAVGSQGLSVNLSQYLHDPASEDDKIEYSFYGAGGTLAGTGATLSAGGAFNWKPIWFADGTSTAGSQASSFQILAQDVNDPTRYVVANMTVNVTPPPLLSAPPVLIVYNTESDDSDYVASGSTPVTITDPNPGSLNYSFANTNGATVNLTPSSTGAGTTTQTLLVQVPPPGSPYSFTLTLTVTDTTDNLSSTIDIPVGVSLAYPGEGPNASAITAPDYDLSATAGYLTGSIGTGASITNNPSNVQYDSSTGIYTFNAQPGFSGIASFTYTLTGPDGTGGTVTSNTGTVFIYVPPLGAPVFSDLYYWPSLNPAPPTNLPLLAIVDSYSDTFPGAAELLLPSGGLFTLTFTSSDFSVYNSSGNQIKSGDQAAVWVYVIALKEGANEQITFNEVIPNSPSGQVAAITFSIVGSQIGLVESDGTQVPDSVANASDEGAWVGSDSNGQQNLLKIILPAMKEDGGYYTISAPASVLIWTNDNETGQVVPGVTTFDATQRTTLYAESLTSGEFSLSLNWRPGPLGPLMPFFGSYYGYNYNSYYYSYTYAYWYLSGAYTWEYGAPWVTLSNVYVIRLF
jgi:hypothetical protein